MRHARKWFAVFARYARARGGARVVEEGDVGQAVAVVVGAVPERRRAERRVRGAEGEERASSRRRTAAFVVASDQSSHIAESSRLYALLLPYCVRSISSPPWNIGTPAESATSASPVRAACVCARRGAALVPRVVVGAAARSTGPSG